MRRILAGVLAVSPLFPVPVYGSARFASPAGMTLPSELVDLNTAKPEELAALPGMGAVYARRVVEARPYSAKNQLVTRGVLPANAYEQIKDSVVAHRRPKS